MAGKGAPLGNTNGVRDRQWLNMLRRKVAQNPEKLEQAALAVLDAAAMGEPWAITELGNRLDGKPVQQVDMSGDLTMHKTYRDLSDDRLMEIAAQAQALKQMNEDGETLQ